ncbi:unnamed protein product [Effrenium voratum]|uniref:Fe2OG dioxygenase domain-containing protein n=1 Tax=Effrenium voratum TaxID=2562239 RepID=A0AA36MG64_9DINO|nr:unnamed protein product [Effrenium voratum]
MATLHGLFEQQVPKAPSKVAVQWREASLSYAELDRCADAMAGRLCREGARRGEIVGLMLDRSLEMVVAIIGCLKSGAAYVTLLPTWPAQQRLEILREAESRILILQSSFHEDLAAFDGAKLTFDDCRLSEPSTSRVPVEATDLAYIIYTSGSTGKPKGVMMHHGGTANNIACNAHLSCSEASRCCFSNKYSFDVHVADIFKPLSVGATVVVTRDIFRIPPVDVVSTLPNKIAMAKVPKSLRTIIFTGEVENALERPERWVLKPQREGGGNNFFGAALAEQLRGNDLSQFVLMEKIVSPSMPAMLLKAGVATSVEAVSELGIFSAHLAVDHEILSTVGGAMLRTKASSSEEGGVCAGHGAIDTPLVVSEVGGQGGAHAGQIPAEKCLLLVCGLPGSGKTQFCKALADSAAKFFLVTTWHHLSYDSPSRTERETISNRVDALLTAPGSAAILLDDNMYSSITRAHWAQVAIDKNCAFHQLFLKAPLDLCLERNSLRPSAVPDFSIRYMAEVFEWPQDGTWEGQHSMMLNAQETASQQVDSFLHHLPAAKFWERVRPPDTALPRKDAHNMDLDLRKIVSLALKDAKLPKLAMPVLAKQWSTRKAALVAESQAKASAADTSALRHEMVETFLRSCMADVSAASAASPSKQDGPDKDLDKEEVSVLGPPFRWLPAECGCYFTDNIYARLVDAYFKVLNPEMEAAEFWKVNDREYDAATRSQIFAEAVNTAKRRKEAPQVFRKNLSTVLKQYRPKHPELFLRKADVRVPFPPSQAAEVFKSGFLEIWEQARGGKELGAKHVHDSCHECPFLSDAFVEQLKAELRHFKEQKLPHQQPNSMNRNGCILNEIGLGPLMDRMIYVYLMPVCRALYPDLLPGVDSHHSFIVEYGPNMDTNLGVHDDNSEVTINVSLSQDYSGGELVLYHRARVAHPQKLEKKPYYHRTTHGTMLLHPGELLHEVLPVTAGNRQGLIIWLRSDAFRKKHGCPLCQSTDRLLYA